VIRPKTDNTVDLGTSTLEFKDLFIDGTANIDTLQVDESATIAANLTVDTTTFVVDATNNRIGVGTASPSTTLHISTPTPIITLTDTDNPHSATINTNSSTGSLAISADTGNAIANSAIIFNVDNTEKVRIGADGRVGIGTSTPTVTLDVAGSAVVDGDLLITGNTTIGFSATDTATFVAQVNSSVVPATDNTYDLGSSTKGWKDIYVDGTSTVGIVDAGDLKVTNAAGGSALLQRNDTSITSGEVIGTLGFRAPNVSGGGNAILTTADIRAVSEGTFDATNNQTKLQFRTATNGAVTTKMELTNAGNLAVDTNTLFVDAVNNRVGVNNASPTVDLDVTGTAIISASSASDALRITQTGAGNALVVEDSANPDSSPFVVNTAGNVGVGTASPARALHVKNTAPFIRLEDTDTAVSTIYGEINSNTEGSLTLSADPGNATALSIISFNVDGTERARFNSTGAFLLGTTVASDRTLSVSKAITGATTAYGVINNGEVQSDVTAIAYMNRTQPSVAAAAFTLSNIYHYSASQGTVGAGSTVNNQVGFLSESTLVGATSNYGFWAAAVPAANVTTGKTVYGFVSSNPIATGGGTSYNIFSNGTAPNYFAGTIGIGVIASAGDTLRVKKDITGAVSSYGIRVDGAIQSDVTSAAYMNRTFPTVADAVFTLPSLYHYSAGQSTIGASATVSSQVGYLVEANLIGAAANVGFQVNGVAAASVTTGKTVRAMQTGQATASGGGTAHNLYIGGSAPSYFQGSVGIGTDAPTSPLVISKSITGGTNAFSLVNDGTIQTDVTGTVNVNRSIPSVVASHPGVSQLLHYVATQGTFGAGSTVTTQAGFQVAPSLIGATANIGFWHAGVAAASVTAGKTIRALQSNQATASGGGVAHNLYVAGTAPNYFEGNVGLGTDAPARALHIKNTTGHIRLENTSATAYGEITTGGVGEVILSSDPANAAASSAIVFQIDGTERFRMGQNGGLSIGGSFGTTGQALISAGGSANTWGPVLTNGTYTPTLTAVTNVAASTSASCQWMRVGSTVTVSGVIAVTATAANTDTHLGISLPVASNLALSTNLGGTGASVTGGALGQSGGLDGDTTNDRARFVLRPTGTGSVNYSFSFTYQVI
jgi:hypothetical protein